MALVLYQPPPTAELRRRSAALAELQIAVRRAEEAYDRHCAALREFRRRWAPAAGRRLEELDRLREALARVRAEIEAARAGRLIDKTAAAPSEEAPVAVFRPEAELRALFRDLARRIHPDRAEDGEDRLRRHEFMAEATRAYRARDGRRLQWLLEHWQSAPRPALGADPESRLARVNQRIAWLRYRLREINALIAESGASAEARLMEQARLAAAEGRNFIAERRAELVRDLEAARAEEAAVEACLREFPTDATRLIRANARWPAGR